MELDNPYLEEKRKLTVEYSKNPSPELKEKLEEIEQKYMAWTRDILDEHEGDIEKIKETQDELFEKAQEVKENDKLHKTPLLERARELHYQVIGKVRNGELVQEGLVQRGVKLKRMLRDL